MVAAFTHAGLGAVEEDGSRRKCGSGTSCTARRPRTSAVAVSTSSLHCTKRLRGYQRCARTPRMATEPNTSNDGLMPKAVTGVTSFIGDNPRCDGRGITIGVLDTGIDPGAPGLRTTVDGRRKIVDIVDCSGSGDVDTSTIVKGSDGTVEGLSKRTLRLTETMMELNPSGEYHAGVVSGFHLFPGPLVTRLKKERWNSVWLPQQRRSLAEAEEALVKHVDSMDRKKDDDDADRARQNKLVKEDLEQKVSVLKSIGKDFEDPGPVYDCLVFHDGTNWRSVVDVTEKGELEKCDLLENYRVNGRYSCFSTMDQLNFGVNIYNDGDVLSIVVDAGQHGTHVAGIIAAHFPDNPELNGVAPGAQIVSLKIGDTRLGSMETHQGLIRALTQLTNGADNTVVDDDPNRHSIYCDLLNMSYGEPTSEPDAGRFAQLASELVNKYKVMFVSSAGNAGPALSTVSAPGGTTEAIMSVGAYVTPDMAQEAYSLLPLDFLSRGDGDVQEEEQDAEVDEEHEAETIMPAPRGVELSPTEHLPKLPPNSTIGVTYTWCSRGPTTNGALGMSVCAPGGAVTSVPQWTLRKKMLLNGTSMASPSACGVVALLMSYAKSLGNEYSPIRLRRALESTGSRLYLKSFDPKSEIMLRPDKFSSGYGSVNLPEAAHYYKSLVHSDVEDLRWTLSYQTVAGVTMRGVYLRTLRDSLFVKRFLAHIDVARYDAESVEDKAYFTDMEITLNLIATEKWVSAPTSLVMLGAGGRSFPIAVDPTQLPAGRVSYAEIRGFLANDEYKGRGPLFRFPVTVVKPIEPRDSRDKLVCATTMNNLRFGPGEVKRFFFVVPIGATLATMNIHCGERLCDSSRDGSSQGIRRFIIQVMCVRPMRNREMKTHFTETLAPDRIISKLFEVHGGDTIELCVSQFWSSAGRTKIDKVELLFGGLKLEPSAVHVEQGCNTSPALQVSNSLLVDAVPALPALFEPKATLSFLRRTLAPVKASIVPMSARDCLPKWQQTYKLTLQYSFSLTDSFKVKVSFPGTGGRIYESIFEGGPFHAIVDANKSLLHVADCYTSSTKLPAGKDYSVYAVMRHDNLNILEDLRTLNAVLHLKLASDINLECYNTAQYALLGGSDGKVKSNGTSALEFGIGEGRTVFLGAPKRSSLPKGAQIGDTLFGQITVDKLMASAYPGNKSSQLGPKYNLSWTIGPNLLPNGSPSSGARKAEKPDGGERFDLGVELRNAKIDRLRSLLKEKKLKEFDQFNDDLGATDYVPLLALRLERMEEHMNSEPKKSIDEVLAAADALIKAVPTQQMAQSLGVSADPKNDAEVQERKEMEKNKGMYCMALLRKAHTLIKRIESPSEGSLSFSSMASSNADTVDQLDDTLSKLQMWTDGSAKFTGGNQDDVAIVQAKLECYRGRYGLALKALSAPSSSPSPSQPVSALRAKIFKELGWTHAFEAETTQAILRYPKSFTLF